MRRPRPRVWLRWTTRWSLSVFILAIAIAWPLGGWWTASWHLSCDRSLSVYSGCLWLSRDDPTLGLPTGLYVGENYMGREMGQEMGWRGMFFFRFMRVRAKSTNFVAVPLWAPLLVAALPAGLLWWPQIRDRRRRRHGHCDSCGYDLGGLPADGGAAVCPECGQARPTPATPPEPA